MSIRFLILNTDYPECLYWPYVQHLKLERQYLAQASG
jgi:hypothetical protein